MSCIVPEENRYKIGSAMGTHRCAYVKSPRWTGFASYCLRWMICQKNRLREETGGTRRSPMKRCLGKILIILAVFINLPVLLPEYALIKWGISVVLLILGGYYLKYMKPKQ